MVSRIIPVEVFDLVIFGGTGDLARRKILPALFRRFCAGQMGDDSRIVAAARSEMSDQEFRDFTRLALKEFVTDLSCEAGTIDEHPNWRRRLGPAPEALGDAPALHAAAEAMRAGGR